MLRFLCFVTTFFVLSSACLTVLSVAFQDVQDLCQSSDVLWLWSGALTSRSIRFKFGLREGYTCADSDFVLYAFPELLKGEKPHSAVATCHGVDGGEEGYGEERSPSSYKTPNVKECHFLELPYSDRKYRYELTLFRSGATVKSGSFTTPKEEGNPFDYRVAFASCADEVSDPKVKSGFSSKSSMVFVLFLFKGGGVFL